MGKFSKIFHHIETKDLRNKYEQKKVAKIQEEKKRKEFKQYLVSTMETKKYCLLYTSPSPRDRTRSRMPSSA